MKSYVLAGMLLSLMIISAGAQAQEFGMPYLKVSLVKYEPFPAAAGQYMDVYLKAENSGLGEARSVECEFIDNFPFTLDPNEDYVKSMGAIPSFDYALFGYKVRVDGNAIDGDNELKIKCSHDGLDSGVSLLKTFVVSVESSNPEFAVGMVTSAPAEIKAGMENVKLAVEIQNVGEGDAQLTIVELELPEGISATTSYSNSFNMGTIQKESSKEAVFYIDVGEGTEAGSYPGVLKLKYKNANSNDYIEKNMFLDINVKPSPKFSVEEVRVGVGTSSDSFTGYIVKGDSVVSPSSLEQGSASELRITVKNTGEEEAKGVSVKVFKDTSHPFTFDEIYDFIGNLAPGDSSDAVFRFTVDGNAVLKKYLVDTEIRFIDDNDVGTERVTVPVEVSRESTGGMLLYIPVLIAVIVVAGFIWKRKK